MRQDRQNYPKCRDSVRPSCARGFRELRRRNAFERAATAGRPTRVRAEAVRAPERAHEERKTPETAVKTASRNREVFGLAHRYTYIRANGRASSLRRRARNGLCCRSRWRSYSHARGGSSSCLQAFRGARSPTEGLGTDDAAITIQRDAESGATDAPPRHVRRRRGRGRARGRGRRKHRRSRGVDPRPRKLRNWARTW